MPAAFRVDAIVRQHESFYRATGYQMRGNNFSYIRVGDMPVPDGLRIDDHGLSMFALVETPSLIDANLAFQTSSVHSLLKPRLQLRFAIGITAGSSATGFALIDADKYVPLILCQEVLLLEKILSYPFIIKGCRR